MLYVMPRFIRLHLTKGKPKVEVWDDTAGEMVLILFQGWIGAYSLGTISSGPLVRWVGEEKCNKPRHVASSSGDIEPSARGRKIKLLRLLFPPLPFFSFLLVFVSNVDSRFAIQPDRAPAWKILASVSFRARPSFTNDDKFDLGRNQLSFSVAST